VGEIKLDFNPEEKLIFADSSLFLKAKISLFNYCNF
jgi:prefoldin subunit 5